MNIKIKTGLKWLIATNLIIFVLPLIYMVQHEVVDCLLVAVSITAFTKFILSIMLTLQVTVKVSEE